MITVLLLLRLDLRLLSVIKITVKGMICADPRVFCGFMSSRSTSWERRSRLWGLGGEGGCGRLVWVLEVCIH